MGTQDKTIEMCAYFASEEFKGLMYLYFVFILGPISLYTSGLKALYDPSDYTKYSPSSQVACMPLTERQRLKDDHLSMSLRFFNLPLQGRIQLLSKVGVHIRHTITRGVREVRFPVNLTPLSRNNFVLWVEPLYIIFQGGVRTP